jgi:putrescine transport system ATP-binding protein
LVEIGHGISCAPNQEVAVAIRPEKIRLSREVPEQQTNLAKGMVLDIAYMGSQSIFRIRLNSGQEVRVTQPNMSRDTSNRIMWDEQVYLAWDAYSCVVLTS